MMQKELIQSQVNESNSRRPGPALWAMLIGLGLVALFTIAWPGAPKLAVLARWPASLAIGLLAVALTGQQRLGPTRWNFLLGGQLLGLLAVGLFFFASLIS